MAALDTLQILIEADSTGLTTQLKKAGATIQSFVNDMNKQEVNWQSIMTRAISPAIISGIAATFALALEQSLTFSNAMTESANVSTTAFQDNASSARDAALSIQSTTGQSASTVAQAMGYATRALGNYADGQALVAQASKYSLSTGQDLMTLVQELTPAMQMWGVTGAANVTKTITQLFGVAAQGKVPLSELLDTLTNTGAFLKGKTSIIEAGSSLEAFSNQAGMTAATAQNVFTSLAKNLADNATAANNMVLGFGGLNSQIDIIKSSGMAGFLATMEEHLTKIGDSTSSILLHHLGFSPEDTQNLINADKSFASIAPNSKSIAESSAITGQKILDNVSATGKLKVVWGELMSALTPAGDMLVKSLTVGIQGINALINGAKEGIVSLVGLSVKLTESIAGTMAGDKLKESMKQDEDKMLALSQDATKKGDAEKAKRFTSMYNTMVASDAEALEKDYGIKGGTGNSPAGTVVNNNTTHNVVNNNISSTSIGAGKGVNSQSLENSLHAGQFGY